MATVKEMRPKPNPKWDGARPLCDRQCVFFRGYYRPPECWSSSYRQCVVEGTTICPRICIDEIIRRAKLEAFSEECIAALPNNEAAEKPAVNLADAALEELAKED